MIIEARLRGLGKLEIRVEIRAKGLWSAIKTIVSHFLAYLNCFSSSMTCMPCSYCSLVGASPTDAKWPFMVITEGAVGNLAAADGLMLPFVSDDGMVRAGEQMRNNTSDKYCWLVTCGGGGGYN
jgi:hypothetical protein